MNTHILKLEVKNHPGILARVAGLFNRRAYNIDSFSSGQVREGIYGMTIALSCSQEDMIMIQKQLNKLIDVVFVEELTDAINHEVALIAVHSDVVGKMGFQAILEQYDVRMIEESDDRFIYRICASTNEVNAFVSSLESFEILSINRSGAVAI